MMSIGRENVCDVHGERCELFGGRLRHPVPDFGDPGICGTELQKDTNHEDMASGILVHEMKLHRVSDSLNLVFTGSVLLRLVHLVPVTCRHLPRCGGGAEQQTD